MNSWKHCLRGWGKRLAVLLTAAGAWVGGTGCNRSQPVFEQPTSDSPATVATPSAKSDAPGETPSTPTVEEKGDRLHQSFVQATRLAEDPPEGSERPVDVTRTGKSVGKLYTEVVRAWPTIRFTTDAGARVEPVAVLDTELGEIEITLNPELAPNHVRNFLALAQCGYYDGLCFDRVRYEEGDETPTTLEQIEAGCPLGVGEPGFDHLGYWLRPEFDNPMQPTASHDIGTVGACRGSEMDSAGTRFYITLNKAPFLDGYYTVFGKVTRGLDVARKIYQRPIVLDDKDVNGSRRPEQPVTIRKVTIQTRTAEGIR